MEIEIDELKNYLLGDLPPETATEIDLCLISDGRFEEQLLFAENELIEDYLEGYLTKDQQHKFRREFLVTSERRTSLDEIARLKQYASVRNTADAVTQRPASGVVAIFADWILARRIMVAGAAVLLVVAVTAVLIWRDVDRATPRVLSDQEIEYARLNKEPVGDTLAGVTLSEGVFRESGNERSIQAQALPERVALRLVLPPERGAQTSFEAELFKGGSSMFYLPEVQANPADVSSVRVLLPKGLFSPGAYELRLTPKSDPTDHLKFTFAVR